MSNPRMTRPISPLGPWEKEAQSVSSTPRFRKVIPRANTAWTEKSERTNTRSILPGLMLTPINTKSRKYVLVRFHLTISIFKNFTHLTPPPPKYYMKIKCFASILKYYNIHK